jgi:hypothetical protein
MSNCVAIEPTKFINIRTGEKSYGFLMYDGFDRSYDDSWESIPKDDMEILQLVLKSEDEVLQDMFLDIYNDESDIKIGGNWYSWNQIKKYFSGIEIEENEIVEENNDITEE